MISNTNKKVGIENFNWKILLIISLVSMVMGIYRDGFASLFPFLQREFELTRAQMGSFITVIYTVGSIFSIYTGRLVDQKGSKWGLISGILLVGILLLLHSIAPNFMILLAMASLAGLGISINAPAANKGITEWFSRKWRSIATGIWSAALPVGALLAAILLPFFGNLMGWRKAILLPGTLALLCAFLVNHFYQDRGKEKDDFRQYDKQQISFWKSFKQLLTNVDLMAISIYGFFLGTVAGAITSHFTLFLYLDYGLNERIAGLGFAFVQFGSIMGKPGWGFICDQFLGANKSKSFLWMGFSFLLTIMVCIPFLNKLGFSLAIIYLSAFFIGFSGRGWHGLYFSSIPEIVRREQVGFAMGLVMLFLRLGILLTPPLFGYLADLRNSYDFSWFLLGFIMFIASIGQFLFFCKNATRKQKSILDPHSDLEG